MSASDDGDPIDEFYAELRQGDFLRAACMLVVQKGALSTTVEAKYLPVDGVVIVTQTCDLVTRVALDPHVQLAKLFTEQDERQKSWLASGHVPQVVAVPNVDGLFADLSVVGTVEKASLVDVEWERSIVTTQADDFANAIGRKSSRFAFPDPFQHATKKLRDRIRNKYGKPDSPAGRVLTKVRQVRAVATPGWSSESFAATLTFIVDPAEFPIGADPNEEPAAWIESATIAQLCTAIEDPARSNLRPRVWHTLAQAWADLCTTTDAVTAIDAEVAAADEYSAADMWTSQRLDMDYLSEDEDPHSQDE